MEHSKTCPCRNVKPFVLEGDEFAEIVHQGSAEGPQAIDIRMDAFTPGQARKFAAWLIKAADAVTEHNRRRKRPPESAGPRG